MMPLDYVSLPRKLPKAYSMMSQMVRTGHCGLFLARLLVLFLYRRGYPLAAHPQKRLETMNEVVFAIIFIFAQFSNSHKSKDS